jgi:hypothetical protein
MATTTATTRKSGRDRDHANSNTSNTYGVSCHSYHLGAVDVTMPKYMVVTMIPMMGYHQDSTKKYKSLP